MFDDLCECGGTVEGLTFPVPDAITDWPTIDISRLRGARLIKLKVLDTPGIHERRGNHGTTRQPRICPGKRNTWLIESHLVSNRDI